MMNSVKKFGQVEINHRLITVLQISCCFGNGGVSAAIGAEPVTAGVKGRLEDRLQDLEHRLLNHPDPPRSECLTLVARLLALAARPGEHRRADSIPPAESRRKRAMIATGLSPPPPRPSVRPLPVLPCCAPRSAAPGPDWLRSLPSSSSRLVSATPALGPLVFLRFALCSRKLRRSDASEGSAFPPPEGLSANTKLNCRGPVFLNPSPPLLRRLSPASSLL